MTVKVQREVNSAPVVFDWRPVLAMGQACIRIGWTQSKCNGENFHPYNIDFNFELCQEYLDVGEVG